MQIEPEAGPITGHVCIIAIGMAGSGKTTLVSKYIDTEKLTNIESINLDPAVLSIPYKPFIDIRDTFNYKKVMKDYSLGPNGAIMTALNLFSAQPERVIQPIQKKIKDSKKPVTFIIDIPGQIQVFTWSASSMILTKSIAMLMPVVLLYVVDSVRCQNPNSYLSNLLFAQSIECRLDYPMIICLNKVDIVHNQNCLDWTQDYEKFNQALNKTDNYLSTLSKSVVLYMSDFFQKFKVVMVSGKQGRGMDSLRTAIGQKARQYNQALQAKKEQHAKKETEQARSQIQQMSLAQESQQVNSEAGN